MKIRLKVAPLVLPFRIGQLVVYFFIGPNAFIYIESPRLCYIFSFDGRPKQGYLVPLKAWVHTPTEVPDLCPEFNGKNKDVLYFIIYEGKPGETPSLCTRYSATN